MQLDRRAKKRIEGTTLNFGDGVVAQRIDTAGGGQTPGKGADLVGGPVVFGFDESVFVVDWRAIGIAELVGERKYEGVLNSRSIEQWDQIGGEKRFRSVRELCYGGAEKMLMVVVLRPLMRGGGGGWP